MARDADHYDRGTSHSAFAVFVVAAALFVAGIGYSIWPGFQPAKGPAAADGGQVKREASPTAKTGETPITDKTPAPKKAPAQQ
jgi:hypothetical protein